MDNAYSVAELNKYIKSIFDSNIYLNSLSVVGEISNYKVYPSGHHYFSLKDETGQIKCVMFKSSATSLSFKPENGMMVFATGSVSVYERDGVYQLYCKSLLPAGVGDLQRAYEQLKEKLSKEGLFDECNKKKLPQFPTKIAVITSPAGAAVKDIIRILGSRWPIADVVIIPVRVQGSEAPYEIKNAIEYVNANVPCDLIITGRGGGSIEDLWAFNDEIVARAIYSSKIPIISGVGHEPDITISDYVADIRASTPSNAAEIAVPDIQEIRKLLKAYATKLNPTLYISNHRLYLDNYRDRFTYLINGIIQQNRSLLISLASSLDAMSPLKVLGRGYAVISNINTKDKIISTLQLKSGDVLSVKLHDGSAKCEVLEVLNDI